MKYLVNSREMQKYDANTVSHFKVPGLLLMERAAITFVNELHKQKVDLSEVLIVCGSGNNGGEGLAIARLLFLEGHTVTVVFAGNKDHCSEQNRIQQDILNAYGVPVYTDLPEQNRPTTVIDALFGVGLSRDVTGTYADILCCMNTLPGEKVAVDIASGISADTGAVLGMAFRADITITFAFAKLGSILWPGNEYAGRVIVCDIGITKESWLGETPSVMALETKDLLLLPERKSHSNKGSYGKLLLIAGSVNMAGAAVLSAKAAYATGCGLVRVLTPEENRIILQSCVPEAVLTTYDKNAAPGKAVLQEAFDWADAIVAGPGLGKEKTAAQILNFVLEYGTSQEKKAILFDADALNLIAEQNDLPEADIWKNFKIPAVITPHPGEMSRLTGKTVSEIQHHLLQTAADYAKEYHVVCVLKDEHTVTALPDGKKYLNLSGNSGMATAGSGDVLSGVIGTFMAQKITPYQAAPLGVYLHGLSGDLMIRTTGLQGLTASDLICGIKKVLNIYTTKPIDNEQKFVE